MFLDNFIFLFKMDIEKIRRLSKNASEAGQLVKAVTAFKNELKD